MMVRRVDPLLYRIYHQSIVAEIQQFKVRNLQNIDLNLDEGKSHQQDLAVERPIQP